MESNEGLVLITINSVNDPPVLNQISDLSFDEDDSTTITLSGSDIEGDDLVFSVTGGTNIDADLDGNTIAFTANQDFNGAETFTIELTDGDLSVNQTLVVTVNGVNDAPVLNSIDNLVFNEDGSENTILSGTDIDGDNLTYTITNGVNIFPSIDGNNLTFNSNLNFNGMESFEVTVSDGVLSATQIIDVTVLAVNDAPILDEVSTVTFQEDSTASINVFASDIDGDNLTYTITSGLNVNATISEDMVTFSAPLDYFGTETLTLTASDGLLNDTQDVVVTIMPINDAPIITSTAIETATEDTQYLYQVLVSDSDDSIDALTFSLTNEPTGMSISQTGLITWTPHNNELDPNNIQVIVSDGGEDSSVDAIQNFSISITQVNDMPEFTSTPIELATEDTLYSYTVTGQDIDTGQTVSVEMVSSNDWLVFDAQTNTLSGTPMNENVGNHSIILRLTTDGTSDSVDQQFSINVVNTNDAPVISNLIVPPSSVLQSGYIRLHLSFQISIPTIH